MKRSRQSLTLILIGLGLFLSVAQSGSATSHQPRPHEHQKPTKKKTQTAKAFQPEPTVPLRDFDAAQSAVLNALDALHAEQEARTKQEHPQYEPFYAPSNLISLGLLVVGIAYSYLAWKQWTAIKQQAEIAADTLLLQNRPRIKVRTFFLTRWEPNNLAIVEFQVVNYGGTTAYFLESNCNIAIRQNLAIALPARPQQLQRTEGDNKILDPGSFLEPGMSRPVMYSPDTIFTWEDRQGVANDSDRLYVLGYIIYSDRGGQRKYRTAFARRFSVSDQEFKLVEKPDYDYED
jgi:hypothetical protein